MTYPVVIVNADPLWPQLYIVEKIQILRVLGGRIADIEHIGSTAVPAWPPKVPSATPC